uniref:Uncharacterized protein n=1 Tax=Oryza rufipogon TaxID=4529 RepID=A0A0E0P662_ORYRU
MSALQILNLAQNNLSGSIPPSLGKRFSMSNNKIEGFIPASLANASKLQWISLNNNKLVGTVPSLGSLSNLYILVLGNNYLESKDWAFLKSLSNCTRLQIVAMGGN